MVIARAREWLRYTVIVSVMLFLKINGLEGVGITIIESAVAKGAVCLDGSPPAYQLDKGFGDGVNNWLVHMQWGGWCHTVENCVDRKTMSNGLGSSKLMFKMDFSGILSNKQDLNPNFYNWNRVIMRYCDGSSFTGDVEEVDSANNLYYRGARVFDAIVEELMSFGMKDAHNALLTGCSAGGLAAILNCDKFRGFFPSTTRVKCVPDAGYFSHVKDLSGEYHLEQYYDKIVTLHGSAKRLPLGCTSTMKPGLCFYPQFVMPFISTPIFILNSAYDTWQVYNILASDEADLNGDFTKFCSRKSQLERPVSALISCPFVNKLKAMEQAYLALFEFDVTKVFVVPLCAPVFRSDFLESVSAIGNNASNGMFINTCYTHCQSETQSSWLENPASKVLDDKTISEGVGDWFYDKSEVRKIDAEHVLPHYC